MRSAYLEERGASGELDDLPGSSPASRNFPNTKLKFHGSSILFASSQAWFMKVTKIVSL